jgi:type VI secretion system protein VasI
MRPAFLPLIALVIAQPAAAQDECIDIKADLDRLACYDRESGRAHRAVRTNLDDRMRPEGLWQSTTTTSKLTDESNVFLSIRSVEPVACGWNRLDYITLTLRCVENTTALVLQTDCHMTSSEYNSYGDVDYRLDDKPAGVWAMQASTDSRALGLWSGSQSIPAIKEMMGRDELVVRATPYGQSPFTADFDISGLESQLPPLRTACGW